MNILCENIIFRPTPPGGATPAAGAAGFVDQQSIIYFNNNLIYCAFSCINLYHFIFGAL